MTILLCHVKAYFVLPPSHALPLMSLVEPSIHRSGISVDHGEHEKGGLDWITSGRFLLGRKLVFNILESCYELVDLGEDARQVANPGRSPWRCGPCLVTH
jgi:hypothetical protein